MTVTNAELVSQVRYVLDAAREARKPSPGRPTLVKLTGAIDHAVRKALAELAAESVQPDEPDGGAGVTEKERSGNLASAGGGVATVLARGGRLVAWTGFVFGSVMSIAANILHVWLPATQRLPGWSPGVAPQVGAAVAGRA